MAGPLALAAKPSSKLASEVARVQDIAPWFVHDALIHYLAPRGLEQYSGGGWGTRDADAWRRLFRGEEYGAERFSLALPCREL